jgi:hypothetical protein
VREQGSCVINNSMALDNHYRAGLGVTLIGLAYLTGHAVNRPGFLRGSYE